MLCKFEVTLHLLLTRWSSLTWMIRAFCSPMNAFLMTISYSLLSAPAPLNWVVSNILKLGFYASSAILIRSLDRSRAMCISTLSIMRLLHTKFSGRCLFLRKLSKKWVGVDTITLHLALIAALASWPVGATSDYFNLKEFSIFSPE